MRTISVRMKKISNTPKPIGIQVLSDLALAAWCTYRDNEVTRLVLLKKAQEKLLTAACRREIGKSKKGRAALLILPKGECLIRSTWCSRGEKQTYKLYVRQANGSNWDSVIYVKCSALACTKLLKLKNTIKSTHERMITLKHIDTRRRYVLDCVSKDPDAMEAIRKVVEGVMSKAIVRRKEFEDADR